MRLDGVPSPHLQEVSWSSPFVPCASAKLSISPHLPSYVQTSSPRMWSTASLDAVVTIHKLWQMQDKCVEQPFTTGLFWVKRDGGNKKNYGQVLLKLLVLQFLDSYLPSPLSPGGFQPFGLQDPRFFLKVFSETPGSLWCRLDHLALPVSLLSLSSHTLEVVCHQTPLSQFPRQRRVF